MYMSVVKINVIVNDMLIGTCVPSRQKYALNSRT